MSTIRLSRSLAVLAACWVATLGCVALESPVSAQQATVQVATASRGDLQESVDLPATVRGYQVADLHSRVGGFLQDISADIGDRVTKGQVVAVLDVPEMKAELVQRQALVEQAQAEERQAAAALTQAQARLKSHVAQVAEVETMLEKKQAMLRYEETEYNRIDSLVSRGAVGPELLDSARFKQEAARAEIKAARSHVKTVEAKLAAKKAGIIKAEADLAAAAARIRVAEANQAYTREMMNYASIKAPFDGVVTKRMADPGTFVQPAEGNSAAKPILQIVRTDQVRVKISVSMSQVPMLNVGDKVSLTNIDGLENDLFHGAISRMSGEVDSQTRMMDVEVDLDNSQGQLKPGHFGYATITMLDVQDKVLVPRSCVVGGKDAHVFLVVNSKAVKRPVVVIAGNQQQAAIESGVEPGDKVIMNPAGLQEGQTVSVR